MSHSVPSVHLIVYASIGPLRREKLIGIRPPAGPPIRHHGDVPLSEATLLTVAGDLVYARGEDQFVMSEARS
jgi:hypothetical protein